MSSGALGPEIEAEREPAPAVHRGAVLGGLIMVLLLAALDATIVATALPPARSAMRVTGSMTTAC